jgi:hypothetical protein
MDINRINKEAAILVTNLTQLVEEHWTTINDYPHFVQKNFMEIKLFYGDIKYNTWTQSKAYDYFSLLSDLGGYLGLLIGGSALTIVEFVDLLFYNALLKFWRGS